MEESVKKVINSLRNFFSETNLSSCVNLTVDWDSVTSAGLPDTEHFNKHLTALASELKNLTATEDNINPDGLDQSNDAIEPTNNSDDSITPCDQSKPDIRLDPMIVQISASNTEIERRIQAFIERKQLEVDDNNRREFCVNSATSSQQENSCARTDAVCKSRSGTRSHVKVSKVVNVQGPQTRPAMVHHLTSLIQSPSKSSRPVNMSPLASSHSSGVEERLRNMESHLKVRKGHGSSDLFDRLKNLENRILHLESVSPEYLDAVHTISKRRRLDMGSPGNEYSIKEIDHKIQQLQDSLLKKKLDMSQDPNAPTSASMIDHF